MIKKHLETLKAYNPNQIQADLILSANETRNYLFTEGVYFDKDTARYPEANADTLRDKLADKWQLVKENFIIGNGSTELLELIVKTYVNQDENIVTFTPSFSMYDIYSKIYNANLVKIEINKDGVMDVDKLITKANTIETKLIFLCTPNNPTGSFLSKENVLKVITNTKALVVVDEAYMDFAFDQETVVNFINTYPNLIVARTFSKAYGLAAFRLGYLVANKVIINNLLKVKLPYNVNQSSIEIGKQALERKQDVETFITKITDTRNWVMNKFSNLPITVYPSKANFVFVKSNRNIYQALLKKGILIRSFHNDTYRITIGTQKEMELVYQILKEELL